MSHFAIGLVLALASGAAPADAPTTDATPAAEAAPAAQASKPRKICTKERAVGTNMPKRVCRDADAAAEQGERARDVMRDAQRNRFSGPSQDL